MRDVLSRLLGEETEEADGVLREERGRTYEAINGRWVLVPEIGWDAWDAQVRARLEEEQRLSAESDTSLIAERFDAINVPQVHRAILLSSQLKPTKAIRSIKRFMGSGKQFCVLAGPAGCGKTLAGEYWLWQSKRGKFPRRRLNAQELTTVSQFDAEENKALAQASALLLDDVGRAQGKSDYNWQRVEELVCQRHDWQVPTVVTTNLRPEEFAKHAGARVMSRINGSGGVVNLAGEKDLRGEI